MSRAIALLARRDHGRAELGRKLTRYVSENQDPTEVARVLDELVLRGLLSDKRYAAGVARVKSQRFGDARIRHDLQRVGVADEVTENVVATLSGTEVQRAHAIWSRRFDHLPLTAHERAKQARFLQSRGFSFDTISRVLRGKAE